MESRALGPPQMTPRDSKRFRDAMTISAEPRVLTEGTTGGLGGFARVIAVRRAVTADAGYGGVGVKVDLLVPYHRGPRGEAAMVAARNYR